MTRKCYRTEQHAEILVIVFVGYYLVDEQKGLVQ